MSKDLQTIAREVADEFYHPHHAPYETRDIAKLSLSQFILHALETAVGEIRAENERLVEGYATACQANTHLENQLTDLRGQIEKKDRAFKFLAEEMGKVEFERQTAKAEVDVLRGVDCCADGDGPCGVCIKCLKAALEQARKDGERLDWLEKNCTTSQWDAIEDAYMNQDSLRAAIDTARQAGEGAK